MAPLSNITSASPVGDCGDSTLTKITSAVGIISFVMWAALLRMSLRWWINEEDGSFPGDESVTFASFCMMNDEWHMTDLQPLVQLRHKVDWQMDRLIVIHQARRARIYTRIMNVRQMRDECYDTWRRRWVMFDRLGISGWGKLRRPYIIKVWCWQMFGKSRMDKIQAEILAIQKEMNMVTIWTL